MEILGYWCNMISEFQNNITVRPEIRIRIRKKMVLVWGILYYTCLSTKPLSSSFWYLMLRTHFGWDSRRFEVSALRSRESELMMSLLLCIKAPHTHLWWSHSLAPGKSLSCSLNLAAASQSRGGWFCQSTTWWGREKKHGTHGSRLVRGRRCMWVEEKERRSEGEFFLLVVSESSVKLLSLHSRCNAY